MMKVQKKNMKFARPEMTEYQDLEAETFRVTITFPNGQKKTGTPLKLMANKKLVASLPETYAMRLGFLAGVEYVINQRKQRKDLE
jgi:hypothetical protein